MPKVVKAIAKAILPPLIYQLAAGFVRKSSVSTLERESISLESLEGYEASRLVEVVAAKTSLLLDRDISDMPHAERTMMGVIFAASRATDKPLRVLDFGGACGFHYLASKPVGIETRWAVVESIAMVEVAKSFENDVLKFFSRIDEAISWLGEVDFLHSAGTLQYMPYPRQTLHELVNLKARTILWSRMSLTEDNEFSEIETMPLSSNGPGPMPPSFEDALVTYRSTVLPERDFLDAHKGYRLVGRLRKPFCVFLFERELTSQLNH